MSKRMDITILATMFFAGAALTYAPDHVIKAVFAGIATMILTGLAILTLDD